MLLVMQGFSQRKKKEDPKDVQIDTLTRANALLTKQVDSITRDRAVYYGLYTTIKEKVLLSDFDPSRFPQIVDSIRLSRDSSTINQLAPMTSLKDSLSLMKMENMSLRTQVDSLSVAMKTHADKTKLVAELKDLKSLLDAKVITQAEYDEKKKLVMNKWQ